MSVLIFAEDGPDAFRQCQELGLNFDDVIWVRDVEMLADEPARMHIDPDNVHYSERFRRRDEAFERAKGRFGDRNIRKRDK